MTLITHLERKKSRKEYKKCIYGFCVFSWLARMQDWEVEAYET